MSDFDMGSLESMLGGLQEKMDKMKADAANIEVEGTSGGGIVKVRARGDQTIIGVEIGEAAMEDRELLEDLVRAATNEALRRAQAANSEKLAALASGILPPGMLPGS